MFTYLLLTTFTFSTLSAVIATVIYFAANTRLGRSIALAIFLSALGTFAYGFELQSPLLATKYVWIIIRYAAIPVMS